MSNRSSWLRDGLVWTLVALLTLSPSAFGGLALAEDTQTLSASNNVTIKQAGSGVNFNFVNEKNLGVANINGAAQRSLVKFDFSSVPGLIKGAQLVMNMNQAPTAGFNIDVAAPSKAWLDTAATWNKYDSTNSWTTAGGDAGSVLDTVASGAAAGNVTFNINSVSTMSSMQTTNNGFLLKASTENGTAATATAAAAVTGTVSVNGASGTTGSMTPAAAGDVFIVLVSSTVGTDTVGSISGTNGLNATFTPITSCTASNAIFAYKLVAASTTAGTISASLSGTGKISIAAQEYTNVDPVDTVGAIGTCASGSGNTISSSVTPTTTNSTVIAAMTNTTNKALTAGTGTTNDVNIGAGGNNGPVMYLNRATAATTAGTSVSNSTTAVSNPTWQSVSLELNRKQPARFGSTRNGTAPSLTVYYMKPATGVSGTSSSNTSVTANWTNPGTVANYPKVVVTEGPSGSPTLTDGTTYTVGQMVGGHKVLYVGAQTVSSGANSQSISDGATTPLLSSGVLNVFTLNDSSVAIGSKNLTGTRYGAAASGSFTLAAPSTTAGTQTFTHNTGVASLAAPAVIRGGAIVIGPNTNSIISYQPNGGYSFISGGTTTGNVAQRPTVLPKSYTTGTVGTCSGANLCDIAYVAAQDGIVYAFDANSGATLWSKNLRTVSGDATLSFTAPPVVQLYKYSTAAWKTAIGSRDLVIAASNDPSAAGQYVYALSSIDGSVVWSYHSADLGLVSTMGSLDYSNSQLWFGSNGTTGCSGGCGVTVRALNTTTGSAVSTPAALAGYTTTVAKSPSMGFNGGRLFWAESGNLKVYDPAKGAVYTQALTGTVASYPLLMQNATNPANDDVYISTTSGVYKYTYATSTGSFSSAWTFAMTNPGAAAYGYNPPSGAASLYVGDSSGKMYRIGIADGLQIGSTLNISSFALGDVTYDGTSKRIYVGDSNGGIYGYNAF